MGCCSSKEEKVETQVKPEEEPKKIFVDNSSMLPPKNADSLNAALQASQDPILSKYAIGEELGRGAFSVVKKAVNRKTNADVAIKFIDKKYVEKQDLIFVAREIDILKKVNHPNVLKLIEVFELDDYIALIMELIRGGELFYKIVEKGNYSEKDAASIIAQLIDAVAYLHDQGVAHRDLKPENLFCEESKKFSPFRVVIGDFGLSKDFDSGSSLETAVGTPDYVAPEIITAEETYNESVDLWSCGVIAYVLLCGYSPFLANTQAGLFERIIRAEYSFPDPEWTDISEEAKDFIRGLLVKEPKKRATARDCLQHPWLSGSFSSSSPLSQGNIQKKLTDYNVGRMGSKTVL